MIRPTGVLDPVEVRPTTGQVDDLLGESVIRPRTSGCYVTTLIKRMAKTSPIIWRRMRFVCATCTRRSIRLNASRSSRICAWGNTTCWWGQLVAEGLDAGGESAAILDADKEGFLRAERSLIQTIVRGPACGGWRCSMPTT